MIAGASLFTENGTLLFTDYILEGIALVGAYLGVVPFYRMSASVDVVFVVIVRPVANRLLDRFDGSLHKG